MQIFQPNSQQGGILGTIGATPLVQLRRLYPHTQTRIFAKMEAFNPGGSIKDRTALGILKEAIQSGRLKPGNTVIFRKYDSNGDLLVGLAMNRTQLFSSSADFLLDPVVLHQNQATTAEKATAAYFVGAYCLEQDVILKRKIALEKVPEIGYLVCFFNSAGYMMHFYESEAHLFDLATNVIATDRKHKDDFYFCTDADFCMR